MCSFWRLKFQEVRVGGDWWTWGCGTVEEVWFELQLQWAEQYVSFCCSVWIWCGRVVHLGALSLPSTSKSKHWCALCLLVVQHAKFFFSLQFSYPHLLTYSLKIYIDMESSVAIVNVFCFSHFNWHPQGFIRLDNGFDWCSQKSALPSSLILS